MSMTIHQSINQSVSQSRLFAQGNWVRYI